jgi:hypothetical protein
MLALTLAMSVAVIPYRRSPTFSLIAFALNMPIQVTAHQILQNIRLTSLV